MEELVKKQKGRKLTTQEIYDQLQELRARVARLLNIDADAWEREAQAFVVDSAARNAFLAQAQFRREAAAALVSPLFDREN